MSFEVVFTDEASFQVLQIQEWNAERSLTGAQSWLAAFRLAINKLRERGPGFSLAPEAPQFQESLYQSRQDARRQHW